MKAHWTLQRTPNTQKVTIVRSDRTDEYDVGPDVTEFVLDGATMERFTYKVTTFNKAGLAAVSEEFTIQIGDLDKNELLADPNPPAVVPVEEDPPLPATNLGVDPLEVYDDTVVTAPVAAAVTDPVSVPAAVATDAVPVADTSVAAPVATDQATPAPAATPAV